MLLLCVLLCCAVLCCGVVWCCVVFSNMLSIATTIKSSVARSTFKHKSEWHAAGAVLEIECIPKLVIIVSDCIQGFRSVCPMCIPTFKCVYHMCIPTFSSFIVLCAQFPSPTVYFAVDFWAVDAGLRLISKMLSWICAAFAIF